MTSRLSFLSAKISPICFIAVFLYTLLITQASAQTSSNDRNISPISENSNSIPQNLIYGPVKPSDTLWKIAGLYRPNKLISQYNVMMAIFNHNPDAFLKNDINRMAAGKYLNIPDLLNESILKNNNKQELNPKGIIEPNTDKAQTSASTVLTLKNTETKGNVLVQKTQALQITSKQQAITPDITTNKVDNVLLDNLLNDSEGVKNSVADLNKQLSSLSIKIEQTIAKQSKLEKLTLDKIQQIDQVKSSQQSNSYGMLNNPSYYWLVNLFLITLICILYYKMSRKQPKLIQSNSGSKDTLNKQESEELVKKDNTLIQEGDKGRVAELPAYKVTASELPTAYQPVPQESTGTSVNKDTLTSENNLPEQKINKANKVADNQCGKTSSSKNNEDSNLVSEPPTENLNTLCVDELSPQSLDSAAENAKQERFNVEDVNDKVIVQDNSAPVLRSTITGAEKGMIKNAHQQAAFTDPETKIELEQTTQINEIENYNDIEFDKLLEEITGQKLIEAEHSNVVNIQPHAKSSTTKVDADTLDTSDLSDEKSFIEIKDLIKESEDTIETEDVYLSQQQQIDVGLDEFPEFKSTNSHVDVDDDTHGIKSKIDLAEVYIEIGDIDNAMVILKNVIKLGNDDQQAQAKKLLKSLG